MEENNLQQSVQKAETIKMLEKALTVLDVLRVPNTRMGVNELAKKCGINPSTTFRILKTLELNGWVYQCNDGRYITGEKISFVTEKTNFFLALKEVSLFTMTKYTDKYKQAMNLVVREGPRCYILQQSRTKSLVDYVPPVLSDLPFYACAGGKILLSELPIGLVDEILDCCQFVPLTQNTIQSKDVFWNELRTVAKQGYAYDNRESSENGSCIAVAVRNCEDEIIASLSFSGFVGVTDPNELITFLPALKEASYQISKSLYRCWNK